jgi:alpha-1,2-mannosyltransferase
MTYMHTPYTKGELRTKYGRNSYSKIYYKLYSSIAQKRKGKLATLILTNSHYSERIIKETMGLSPKVLYPPIDTSLYKSALSKVNSRLDHIVTIARFTWEKNLQMIPELAKRQRNAIFHIAGSVISQESSEVVKFLKRRSSELNVADRVRIQLNPSIRERLEILSRSKVYINTLKEEHFGMSVAEAVSAGLAPVVPNGGGQVEIVPNREYMYRDMDEAVYRIEEWLSKWNPTEAFRLSRTAERFSYDNFKNNLSKLLTNVSAHRSKSRPIKRWIS